MDFLHSKSYTVTQHLSRYFLSVDVGSRIKIISEFVDELSVSRGTVQNALQVLKDTEAIKLVSKGKLGTFLEEKNTNLLLDFAGINFLVGTMPLPYTKLYEGLGTGILKVMRANYDLPINMAYMRGAQRRIEMVLNGRYDFAIVSQYAADSYLKENPDTLEIVENFGLYSFLSGHVLILKDNDKVKIEDGMRVAIDEDSIDQVRLTLLSSEGKNVEFVSVTYLQILLNFESKNIDAAIWNKDEFSHTHLPYKTVDIEVPNMDNTVAVLVVNKHNVDLIKLIQSSINVAEILDIQHEVVKGAMTPNY